MDTDSAILHYLHKNDEQNDALEAEVFAKCVDEKVGHEEGILHEQHAPVATEGELHILANIFALQRQKKASFYLLNYASRPEWLVDPGRKQILSRYAAALCIYSNSVNGWAQR